MNLKFDEIVSVAGKAGLYIILKPTKNGYIVEELNDSRKKLVLGSNHRVSLLKEISIYTTDTEGAIPLRDVYLSIQKKYKSDLPVNAKNDTDSLFAFLKEIVPNFDSEKVYHSDVKKLVAWYNLILEKDKSISFKDEEKGKEKKGSEKEAKETQAKGAKSSETKLKSKKAPVKKTTAPAKMITKKPVTPQKKG